MPSRRVLCALAALLLAACGPGQPTASPTRPAGPTAATSPSPLAAVPAPVVSPTPLPSPRPGPAGTTSAPSQERYFVLVDANAAFERKDYLAALKLYRQAANDDALGEGENYPPKRGAGPELRAFARFRILLADTLVGQEDDARATLETMRQLDAGTPFLRLGLVFWDTYGMTADPKVACGQVTKLVKEDPQPVLRAMNDWGDATPRFGADDVCNLP